MRWNTLLVAPLEKPWANVVARHPGPFIILPIILTIVLSSDALWKAEEAVIVNHWAADDEHFYPGKDITRRRGLYMIITAKDHGNVLRESHSAEVLKILEWISSSNFTTSSGQRFSYHDVCLRFQNECFTNVHVKLIAKIYSNKHSNKMKITYPIYRTKFATEPVDLSKCLGNVTVNDKGIVTSATAWLLLYQLRRKGKEVDALSSEFENAVAARLEAGSIPTHLLNVLYFHSNTFNQELAKENKRITPMFSVTFIVLIIFAILCTLMIRPATVPNGTRKLLTIDWIISKPWMGIIGVISALMAIVSSTGLLLLLGVKFVDMCTVMPFLCLTIGIDDTFLMLAAFHDTDRKDPWQSRIEATMRHAAVSISITSLTDTMAFLIGAIAPLPAVIYFCYYAAAAIFFIFVYCMTIFTACLSLHAKREEQNDHCLANIKIHDIQQPTSSWTMFFMGLGSSSSINSATNCKTDENSNDVICKSAVNDCVKGQRMWYQRLFEDVYGPLIIKPFFSILALLLMSSYLIMSISGVQNLVVGFDLINIVQENSLSRSFLETRQRLFPEDTTILDIAVMNPPNFSNFSERKHFFEILNIFENTNCSAGHSSTTFWFYAYRDYVQELGFGSMWEEIINDNETFYSHLSSFLLVSEKWDYDVLRDRDGKISAFRLSTRLQNVSSDELIYQCAQEFRNLCNEFSYLNVSTYSPLWNIADQYDIIWPQTMQDLYISIAVMIPVALLFIPQPLCAMAISLNIASIALGVIGSMPYIGVNLDATSMITIAMSVGFSVDFSAHVSYSYMTETTDAKDGECIAEARLRRTLGAVGWPVLQASFSVLLGVSSLHFVDSYVIQTCFKTVVLVICFGTTHALLFLPLSLMYVHKICLRCGAARKNS